MNLQISLENFKLMQWNDDLFLSAGGADCSWNLSYVRDHHQGKTHSLPGVLSFSKLDRCLHNQDSNRLLDIVVLGS